MIAAYVIRLFGVTIACIVPFFSVLVIGQQIDEPCQVARSGAPGICKIINECPSVIDEIVKQGLFPAQCGFRGREQIVCCPTPRTITTTTTPAPSRISQRSKFYDGHFIIVVQFFFTIFNANNENHIFYPTKNFFDFVFECFFNLKFIRINLWFQLLLRSCNFYFFILKIFSPVCQ